MPTVITQGAATAKAYGFSAQAAGAVRGCAVYRATGTYTFTVPAGVTSISMVAIGGGSSGGSSYFYGPNPCYPGYYCYQSGYGGYGGGLGYKNNYTVSPGQTLTIFIGGGCSCSIVYGPSCSTLVAGQVYGNFFGCGGGYGGTFGSGLFNCAIISACMPAVTAGGGGGAGGYSGAGGDGAGWYYCGCACYYSQTYATAGSGGGGGGGGGGYSGGGTGLYGQGSNGSGGYNAAGGRGSATCYPCCYGNIGGGGGGSHSFTYVGCYCGSQVWAGTPGQPGNGGAVRIVYPGTTRQFPSCDVGYP